MYLSDIASPHDVQALPASALPELCQELRNAILTSSSVVGGHVGSNLGVVELTVALHRVFTSPHDKFIFDVSHQTYTHKMLTGRAPEFLDKQRFDDVSGFSSPAESPHDLFSMGHTSTSVSLACGVAKARNLAHEDYHVVAILGDGSLSGGLAYEGLNNAAELTGSLLIIINDNEWSIAENHGGLYRGLAHLRQTAGTASDNIFRALGLDYYYLEEGNDVAACEAALTKLRDLDHPCVLHVHTHKGQGYAPARADAESWHHVGPFSIDTGTFLRPHTTDPTAPTYADITGEYLLDHMRSMPSLVAVSAATPYIAGFTPERRAQAGAQFVDVGIAEEHAVSFCTALARSGAKPVLSIYGTFLQRAYDQLWHDLCLNAAPAVLLVFGSSVYGTTDATHLGFYDIAMLSNMPGLVYLAPTCREEYLAMLTWSLTYQEGPVAIRVPGAGVVSRPDVEIPSDGYATASLEYLHSGCDVAILGLGSTLSLAQRVTQSLEDRGIRVSCINPRQATELNESQLIQLARTHRCLVTLEDGVVDGGFGEHVGRIVGSDAPCVITYGLPHSFPDRYDPEKLLASCGMRTVDIVNDIQARLNSKTAY